MMLETVITNLTSNLDIICQQDGKGVSSHEKLKEKGLRCIITLLKNAPKPEYKNLLKAKNSEILLGYLLSILCRLAKDDKSRTIKLLALETMEVLIDQLSLLHEMNGSTDDSCSIIPLMLALPGVSSVLFKLVISDTKLPKDLIIKSVKILGKLIVASFSNCSHNVEVASINGDDIEPKLGKNLADTCDNVSVRMVCMLNYITNNSNNLHSDVKHEALVTCYHIVKSTPIELVSRLLKSILRYSAFISSNIDGFAKSKPEIQLILMFLNDEIKYKISKNDHEDEQLNSVVLKCLYELLENLETNSFSMLIGERQSELEMLCGLMKVLPQTTITTLLEDSEQKDRFFTTLINLTEFSHQQPLLFLTESQVGDDAIQEMHSTRIYLIEKRFAHLNESEVKIVNTCCNIIGEMTDWPLLLDILRNDLVQHQSASNLYVTFQVIRGCLSRQDCSTTNMSRFSFQTIERYNSLVCDLLLKQNQNLSRVNSTDLMSIVISIETIVVLVELHVKTNTDCSKRVVILKDLLCPLLNWCASSSRCISEASLSALTQISRLYGLDSAKSLIESNTDYIIDGVTRMLNNFACNPEVADVCALTFKLSSKQTLFYFKDVYERIFVVLSRYHQTKCSIPLSRLLYRTVKILEEWRFAPSESLVDDNPLQDKSSLEKLVEDLDIDKIVKSLRLKSKEAERLNETMNKMENSKDQEAEVVEQIKAGKLDEMGNSQEQTDDTEGKLDVKKDCRDEEVILTEKIVKHCVGLMNSNHSETRIYAMKTAACGMAILQADENTLLPIVHQVWSPLMSRLNQNYNDNLEENLCAFECLLSMAVHSKDFIKRRALDTIIPRLCIFLESQVHNSKSKREYGPYCMTMQYKCQLKILSHLGQLAYHTQVAYSSLWRIVQVVLKYLDASQIPSLREASLTTLDYLVALDADCVWFFAKRSDKLEELPALKLVFKSF